MKRACGKGPVAAGKVPTEGGGPSSKHRFEGPVGIKEINPYIYSPIIVPTEDLEIRVHSCDDTTTSETQELHGPRVGHRFVLKLLSRLLHDI